MYEEDIKEYELENDGGNTDTAAIAKQSTRVVD